MTGVQTCALPIYQRWRLTGTFAGRNLDIAQRQSGVELGRFAWPDPGATGPLDIDDLLAHDIDLRLSLQRVRLAGLTLNDVAAQIVTSENRLDVSLPNAGLYRGTLRGRASLARTPAGIELRTQAIAERVELGALSADLFEGRYITGIGSGQQQLAASGRSMAELLASSEGRISLTARDGDMMGTNLNDAMRRIERQPLSAARDWRGGRTNFEQLTLQGPIAGGVWDFSEFSAAGPHFRLTAEGQLSLINRQIKVDGRVAPVRGTMTLPFDITGAVSDPTVQVNARALLNRTLQDRGLPERALPDRSRGAVP